VRFVIEVSFFDSCSWLNADSSVLQQRVRGGEKRGLLFHINEYSLNLN
jgi:hypothetical protein